MAATRYCTYVDRTKSRICGILLGSDARPVLILSQETGNLVETMLCRDHERILLELAAVDSSVDDPAQAQLASYIEDALKARATLDVNRLSPEAIRNALRILLALDKLPPDFSVTKRGPITEGMRDAVAAHLHELPFEWMVAGLYPEV